MQSTAIILRPLDAPKIHVLECDGPQGVVDVHRFPGSFTSPYMSFEEFHALPDYAKNPAPSTAEIDFESASRIYRLVLLAERQEPWHQLSADHLREIRGRLKVLFPFCDEQF